MRSRSIPVTKSAPASVALLLLLLAITSLLGRADAQQAEWPEFQKEVRRVLRSDVPTDRIAIIEEFAAYDQAEAAEFLIHLLERGRETMLVSRKAAEVLGGYRNSEARDLVATAVRPRPAANRHLLLALSLNDHPDGNEIAVQAMREARSPATTTVAIEAVAKTPTQSPDTVSDLVLHMRADSYHTVRQAAARALGGIESGASIPGLIDMLADPLLAEAARDSLLRLTSEEHWTDATAWSAWWTEHGAAFQPVPLDVADLTKRVAELKEKFGDGLSSGGGDFYDRPLTGLNILFLLDSSGSMEAEGRMDRLKSELGFMVEQMTAPSRFGFVLFPHDTFPSRGIDSADDHLKARALRFVERLSPDGGTPMASALLHAFEEIVPEENVDTIYLLSDGEPDDATTEQTLHLIREKNEPLGVAIHTIWVGGEGREFLLQVAEQNGGFFWEAP